MDIKRIKLIFSINRAHICFDIINVLHKYDIGIISMEVYDNVIYLKLPYISEKIMSKIKEEWNKVNGFDYMQEIDLMSFEEKDIELQKILNLINKVLVILNIFGNIEYYNNTAVNLIPEIKVGANICDFIDSDKLYKHIKSNENPTINDIKNYHIQIKKSSYILNIDKLFSQNSLFFGYLLSIDEIQKDVIHESLISFEDIIGDDEKIKHTIEIAKLYSESDSSIFLTGESGTGKEMFARAIHSYSKRANMPFVAINCAAIPEGLLESELFGYAPGAFTGANKQGRVGIFEMAEGGTVFLDEVTEMNYNLQAKLLRVLQEKKIRRIGANSEKTFDVRIISATNKDLDTLLKQERFRLDLFYRLNIFRLHIPPLRERKKDIFLLTKHFLEVFSKRYSKENITIDNEAVDILSSHKWSGNIREMQNVLERAVVLSKNNIISKEQLHFDRANSYDNYNTDNIKLKELISSYEKEVILKTLKIHKSIRASAKALDVTHTLLINRIKKYSISKEQWQSG